MSRHFRNVRASRPGAMKDVAMLAAMALLAGCSAPGATSRLDRAPAGTTGPTAAKPAQPGLEDYVWVLQDARDRDGRRIDVLFPAEDEGRLRFDPKTGHVGGDFGCNSLGGPYLQDGDTLTAKPGEGWIMTLMGCPQNAAESRLAALFAAPQRMRLRAGEPPVLVLSRLDASATTTWRGVPTWPTRHGQPGTPLLLEIAPQPVRCPPPYRGIGEPQCLRVREVPADYTPWNGKTANAPWFVIDGIRGYAHDPRQVRVAQVLRFDVKGDPQYVLEHVSTAGMVEEPR